MARWLRTHGVLEAACPGQREFIVHISSQFCVQQYHVGSLKLATWPYLHHGNWQTLQIRAFIPPREQAVKHLPAHATANTLPIYLLAWLASPNPYISAQILSLQRDLFIQSYPSPLSLSIISFTLSFRALISVRNYLVHVFYVLAYCSASSLQTLSCLVLFTATFQAFSADPDSYSMLKKYVSVQQIQRTNGSNSSNIRRSCL